MTKIPELIVIAGLLVSFPSHGLDVKSFEKGFKMPKTLDLNLHKGAGKLGKISQIKWYELQGNFEKCTELAETNRSVKKYGIWLAVAHMDCLNSSMARKSKWTVNRFLASFKKLEDNKESLINSPYAGQREKLLDVFLILAQLSMEKSRNEFESFVGRNHDLVDYMDEGQRARYYKIMGEFAWLRQKSDLAQANFLRSYRFQSDSFVLKRLKAINADAPLKLNKYARTFNESDEENKLWGKFAGASKKGQTYNVAQYGVEFLGQFPGSQRVLDIRDEINTFYKRLLYRRGEKYVSIKNDFESQLMKAPPEHILFWAREAYERGYQDSSFKLADKAADKWEDTPYAADALIIAGRSAYYRNNRSKAESLFKTLIDKYSGHEASFEAHYLLGLLYFRQEEFKKVIQLYDKFLISEGSDLYELQVRYWLWRSLKKVGSSRSSEIAETIFRIFPLTYYGLIVRQAEKGGLQNILRDEISGYSAQYWWTENNQNRWQRIKNLLEVGWVDEAETEIDFMADPQTPEGYLIRAELWRQALRENRSIEDFASAIDMDLKFITKGLLGESFPQRYEKSVEKAQKEFSISRNMIWAIARQESAFVPRAISPSRAYGLMQLLKPTAQETARWLKVKSFNFNRDIFDPYTNIRFGAHFLSRMIKKYRGVIPLAIASYNVGPGNLDRWLSHRSDLNDWDKIGASPDDDIWMDELPWAETSFYVKAVMRNYLLYKLIHEKYDQLAAPAWKEVSTP